MFRILGSRKKWQQRSEGKLSACEAKVDWKDELWPSCYLWPLSLIVVLTFQSLKLVILVLFCFFLPLFSIVGFSSTFKAFSSSLLITKPLLWALSFLLPQQKPPILHSHTNLKFCLKLARLIFLSHWSDSITSFSYLLTCCIKSSLLA